MAAGDGNMGDNEKLIKMCEKELQELQQIKPVNPDDLDLSWCDADTRNMIINISHKIEKQVKARTNQLNLIISKLKQSDGDNDV